MARCDFCKNVIEKGTGKMFVMKEGKILNFCSHKCEKNLLKLGRNPRTTTWTREYAKLKEARKATQEIKK